MNWQVFFGFLNLSLGIALASIKGNEMTATDKLIVSACLFGGALAIASQWPKP